MSDLLSKLNNVQREAVQHDNGPLLIVAGAGTGKTTVLINRLAYLIINKKIPADQILLLTFTEKAAGEMEERADKILPYGYVDLWISTFHSLGERLLREHALDIGLNANFKILTETDQWVFIRKNLAKFDLDYYRPLGNPTKFISELIKHFSRLKDENIWPTEYLEYVEGLEYDQDNKLSGQKITRKTKIKKKVKGEEEVIELGRLKELANAYHVYNQLLLDNNYLDFGDLIIYTLKLFRERPNILNIYRHKFRYIMVDEFQDTNWAQYELVKLLAAPDNNLVVVGCDDQAIYRFRGASISNIMQFKDDYPTTKEIVLIDNYRSRQEILDYAHKFIQHNNPNRLEVKLKINKKLQAKGEVIEEKISEQPVQFFNFDSAAEEVSFVVQKIKELKQFYPQNNWADFAILVRANDTANAYVKELTRQNIPNQFMSWRGLYYKPLILDILAYLRLLDNYHESAALFRVLNMEAFKVSHIDLITINKVAKKKVWSLYEALKNINIISEVSPESVKNINKLISLISQHSRLIADHRPSKIFLHFAYDSGLLDKLDQDRDLELFSYLNQFYQKIKRMEEAESDLRLADFMMFLELELESGETGALKLDFADHDTVRIMTIHGAKGLEFKYVFIVNLVDKKFPTINRGEKIPIPVGLIKEKNIVDRNAHLEEERRLFYVALTRAQKIVYLTAAKDYGGIREKKPSCFIDEMSLESTDPPKIFLSQRNEFLQDIHQLNSQELQLSTNQYPVPNRFSFSQLAAFSTCPLQYKFAFILKIPVSTDRASLIFGRVLHNTLYNFLLPILNTENIQGNLFENNSNQININLLTEKRLLEIYKEFWQSDGYDSATEREEYYNRGREALKKFWQNYQSEPRSKIIFLEKKFSFKLNQDIIKGTIDRVDYLEDGSLEIIDYKTGKTKEKLSFEDKRQLILYQIFLEEFLNKKVSQLTFYYLESGQKISFVATDKDQEKLRLEVGQEIAKIKERQFIPNPSHLCEFCDFKTICEFRQV